MPTGGIDVAAGSFLADTLGTGLAGAVGTAALGGEVGAGLGGLEGLVTNQNPLTSALKGGAGGALTGGGIGLGGDLLGSTLGTTAADALGGAAGGALGGAVTGGNIGTGALEGGVSGGLAGALSSPAANTAPSGGAGGGGISGVAAPAPVGSGINPTPDITQSAFPSQPANSLAGSLDNTLANNPGIGGAPPGTTSPISAPTGGGDTPLNSASPGTTAPAASGGATPPGTYSGFGYQQAAIPGATEGPNSGFTPPGGGTAAKPNSIVNLFKGSGSIGDVLSANSNLALPAAGVAADAIKGNQLVKGQRQLEQIAGQEQGQGAQLESYLQNGTLPPGVQNSITQAADAAKAQIMSRAAAQGGSGSSATQQELAQVDQWAAGQGAQTAMGLLQTGIQESNLAGSLFADISNQALQQDQQLSNAFGSLAAAAGGQPQGISAQQLKSLIGAQ